MLWIDVVVYYDFASTIPNLSGWLWTYCAVLGQSVESYSTLKTWERWRWEI